MAGGSRRVWVVSLRNSFLFGNGLTQTLQVIKQDREGSWEKRTQWIGVRQEKAVLQRNRAVIGWEGYEGGGSLG